MQLKKSKVSFLEEEHEYWLSGKQLSGITGILGKYVFPDKYSDVPQHILQNAAERGKAIHEAIYMYETFGEIKSDMPELLNYIAIKEANGLNVLSSEYLVSDETNFATMIDLVLGSSKNMVSLADIKTTSVLDKEYLSWQLSINAVLFEMQNPKIKVDKFYGIWLRGEKAELVSIKRIDDEVIVDLLCAAANDADWTNPLKAVMPTDMNSQLQLMAELEGTIMLWEAEYADVVKRRDELKEKLMEAMTLHNVDKWETDNIVVTRTKDTTYKGLDIKTFKALEPEMFEKYAVMQSRKGSLKIKLK
jgi:hypothetical protein